MFNLVYRISGIEEGKMIYVTAAASGGNYSWEVATSKPVVDLLFACGLGYLCHA